jgi:hypothetical protein
MRTNNSHSQKGDNTMRTQLTHVRASSIRPLLAATLALAITFTLSCSDNKDDDGDQNGGLVAGISSSSGTSSSSSLSSSSGSSSSGGSSSSYGSDWALSDIPASAGWTVEKSVKLGGPGSTIGSFLDIDGNIDEYGLGSPMVYVFATVSANADKIDLVFDGTNLFTPTGCLASSACFSDFKSVLAGYNGEDSKSVFYTLPATVAPNTPAAALEQYAISSLQINAIPVATKGIYYLQTSLNSYALILIGTKDGVGYQTIELIIGYKW